MNRLQFITHHNEHYDHLSGAKMALEGGCKWIQLRMKGAEDDEIIKVGNALRTLCDEYDTTFIIDDRVDLVEQIHADGVHLGQKDMPIDQARALLGPDKIIGGTANTIDEIVKHHERGADYIGCGPYRFTTTKENLAPLLGLDGYRRLICEMRQLKITLPMIAIGGITVQDVPDILSVGIYGIAISGGILNSPNPTATTKTFVNQLNNNQHE